MPGYFTYKYTCTVELFLWLKCDACGSSFKNTWAFRASDVAERGATKTSVAEMARRKADAKRSDIEAGNHILRCRKCGFVPLWLAQRIRRRVVKSPGFMETLLGYDQIAASNSQYPNHNWSGGKKLQITRMCLPIWSDYDGPAPNSCDWPTEPTCAAKGDSKHDTKSTPAGSSYQGPTPKNRVTEDYLQRLQSGRFLVTYESTPQLSAECPWESVIKLATYSGRIMRDEELCEGPQPLGTKNGNLIRQDGGVYLQLLVDSEMAVDYMDEEGTDVSVDEIAPFLLTPNDEGIGPRLFEVSRILHIEVM